MDPITIQSEGRTVAYLFPGTLKAPEGVRFLNEATEPLQVGLMERPKGYHVKPHLHPPCKRELDSTPEFLFVQEGRIRITLFDDAWMEIASHELTNGESILILRGGHEVEMLEKTRMFEVKQGPYMGEKNAKLFRPPS